MQPDEIRKLDNRYALLLLRGEAPMLDEKYDLLSHPNIRLTADGGYAPYDHAVVHNATQDAGIDTERYDDYEILTGDELLYDYPPQIQRRRRVLPYENE